MSLQSNVDLRLLNGTLSVNCVLDVYFQYLILHLLISVFTQLQCLFSDLLFSRLPRGLF